MIFSSFRYRRGWIRESRFPLFFTVLAIRSYLSSSLSSIRTFDRHTRLEPSRSLTTKYVYIQTRLDRSAIQCKNNYDNDNGDVDEYKEEMTTTASNKQLR